MERPIEKYGWEKLWEDEEKQVYGTFDKNKKLSKIFTYKFKLKTFLLSLVNEEVSFEELQAIYETAKQIKEEYENRN